LDNGSGSPSMLAETDCRRKYRNTSLWVRFQDSGVIRANARANAPRIAYALFLLKVVAEVIDPVMGSSQLGRIERQIRTIEATNIRVRNLLMVLYPFIGRLQAGDGARETVEKIVRWNYGLRIIFLYDCIHLSAREDWLDRQNKNVNIFQVMIEGGIRRRPFVAPDGDPQSPGFHNLNRLIERHHVVWRTSLHMQICGGTTWLIRRRRFTFVLVGQARYFNIAKLRLSNQTFENHQPIRAVDSVVVEMSVSRKNYVDPKG